MKIEEFILLIIGVLIGTLFGLGFSDWGKIDPGSVTNWLIALGTLALVFIAIYSALSWKAQRIPEARKDFINAIVNFDNHIYKFGTNDFTSNANNFRNYHRELLERFWDVEKSIMYFYQFDRRDKLNIDKKYNEIIVLINKFGESLKINKNQELYVSNNTRYLQIELNDILKNSYDLLKLVSGKDITIENERQIK